MDSSDPPNVDAAMFLAMDIMPLVWREAPDVRLILVGGDPPDEVRARLAHNEMVDVTGYVPDLAPLFYRSRVCQSALWRYGAGVKGKIVSSLVAGVPVVTTAVGNEGIGLVDGREALVGETPEELAAAVLRLLREPALCASLSTAGSEVIRRHFSVDSAREVMQGILRMKLCTVCGHISAKPRDETPGNTTRAAGKLVCGNCGATSQDKMLADVLLGPMRANRMNSLRDAAPELSRLRIHALGAIGPVVEQLRESAYFTCSDGSATETSSTVPLREHEVDLLVSPGCSGQRHIGEDFLREARRVVKIGGRYVLAASGSAREETTSSAAALPDSWLPCVGAWTIQSGSRRIRRPGAHRDTTPPEMHLITLDVFGPSSARPYAFADPSELIFIFIDSGWSVGTDVRL